MKPFLLPTLLVVAAFGPLLAQNVEGYTASIKATPILRTDQTVAGQPIVYPHPQHPEVTALIVDIPPGQNTGWHKHPYPCYAYILSGHLNVDFEGGKRISAGPGEAFAEAVNVLHCGTNPGPESVRLVMFVTGAKGQPFVIKAAHP